MSVFVGAFESTLHNFYTVLSGTCRRTSWYLSLRLGMISQFEESREHHQRSGSGRKNAFAASSAALRYSGRRLRSAAARAAFSCTALRSLV
jgi:hypothetical protein